LNYSILLDHFDWFFALGFYFDDSDAYILAINAFSQELFFQVFLLFFGFVVLIMGSAWTINNWVQYISISRLRAGFETKIAHDTLTEVYSRSAGEDILKRYFELYRRTKQSPAIFVFDIDNFKQINDKHGHVFGDMVLKEVAKLVKSLVRNTDIIYRFGGDEFIMIIDGLKPENTILVGENVVRNVYQKIASMLEVDEKISISMGATYFVNTDYSPIDAISRADKALYQAKSEGKNTIRIL
jgi:diguanylate cyclase (GGDEF)-like protein